ncbi:rhodanese-like domain-containing protein [Stutzerimonas urumqiensis]|uniref:rhodanese-like domain-containing protein n=1 Tax=Stutzerimonas urumqiensis TaxID=638269 RepID=UPI003DA21463
MRRLLLLPLLPLWIHAQAGDIDQPAALAALQQPGTVLIDVRTAEEFSAGALPGAVRISTDALDERIGQLAPDKQTPIVLYCRTGRRSSAAQDLLQELGYHHVVNAGGYEQLAPLLDHR